jgi:hypothetical protein
MGSKAQAVRVTHRWRDFRYLTRLTAVIVPLLVAALLLAPSMLQSAYLRLDLAYKREKE